MESLFDSNLTLIPDPRSIRYEARKAAKKCVKHPSREAFPEHTGCQQCVEETRIRGRKKRLALKLDIFKAYGGIRCVACGCTDVECLSIDHIGGGGTRHRREIGGGQRFYKWLYKNNYPPGYRVVCMNCQFRARFGTLETFIANRPVSKPAPDIASRARQGTGSVVLDKRSDVWSFYWWVNGKRHSRVIGKLRDLPTKTDARQAIT